MVMFSRPPPQFCDQASSLSVHSPRNRAKGWAGFAVSSALAADRTNRAVESAQSSQALDFGNVIRLASRLTVAATVSGSSIDDTHPQIVRPDRPGRWAGANQRRSVKLRGLLHVPS